MDKTGVKAGDEGTEVIDMVGDESVDVADLHQRLMMINGARWTTLEHGWAKIGQPGTQGALLPGRLLKTAASKAVLYCHVLLCTGEPPRVPCTAH